MRGILKSLSWKKPVVIEKTQFFFSCQLVHKNTHPRHGFESAVVRWVNLEPLIQSKVSQKEKSKYHILMHTYEI